jgi:hypothetical protein
MLHEIIVKGRQGGKTQEMLEDAVRHVSQGHQVAWVATTMREAWRIEQAFWAKYGARPSPLNEAERNQLFQAYTFSAFTEPMLTAGNTFKHVYFDNLDMMLGALTRGASFSVSMNPPEET